MSKKIDFQDLLAVAGKFVRKQKGTWTHEDWEGLVDTAAGLGYTMDDEARRQLGLLLEAGRYFQDHAPLEKVKPSRSEKQAKKVEEKKGRSEKETDAKAEKKEKKGKEKRGEEKKSRKTVAPPKASGKETNKKSPA